MDIHELLKKITDFDFLDEKKFRVQKRPFFKNFKNKLFFVPILGEYIPKLSLVPKKVIPDKADPKKDHYWTKKFLEPKNDDFSEFRGIPIFGLPKCNTLANKKRGGQGHGCPGTTTRHSATLL